MNTEVKYNGMSAVPPDYECPDGELAMSLNLINEDGAMKPVQQPKVVMTLDSAEQRVVFVHEVTGRRHYIVKDDTTGELRWRCENTETGALGTFLGFTHCNAVGNTLIVFSSAGLSYFLWKDSEYIGLGGSLPEINLSFGLVGHPRLFSLSDSGHSSFSVRFAESISAGDIYDELNEANKVGVTEQIMGKLNKFIREQSIDKGRFCFPFFVRYALRLYDGSLVCHSAPILMNPSTLPAPIVLWRRISGKSSYTEAECDIMLMACDLDWRLSTDGDYYKLDDWSDIITGIDIFVSKPIYTYDQDGKIAFFKDSDNFDSTFIGRIYHKVYQRGGAPSFSKIITEDAILGPMVAGQNGAFLDCYAEWSYKQIYALYFSTDRTYPSETIHLPEFSADKVGESIRSCTTFYKLHDISVKEALAGTAARTVIPVGEDYLQSLVTREAMTDDYLTHDSLSAEHSLVYNARINLSGVSRKLFKGFSPTSMFAFTDRYVNKWITKGTVLEVGVSSIDDSVGISVYVKEGGKTHMVHATGSCGAFLSPSGKSGLIERSTGCYIFYPNVNATTAVISSNYGNSGGAYGGGSMIVELKPHDFLNGAYALLDFNSKREHNYSPGLVPPATANPYDRVDCGSKVYTSEVNNPFFFPVTGINTVGTGRVKGLATAAKALSQGQFGQFPLYAFTEDGVWAMEVSPTGTFSAKQPITRDVCNNADGITQIDSAVLFPSARGIMLISGSQTQCVSDAINTDWPFDVLSLPGLKGIHVELGYKADGGLLPDSFSEFLAGCGMLYDYVHQRIIVFNKDYEYAYIYSLKSRAWGLMRSSVQSGVNSYPEALATATGGRLVDFTQCADNDMEPAILVTRPLKLNAADVHKTIDTIIQRGDFAKGHVSSILYGSRNLTDWHLVWSSKDHFLRGFRGTPYKYFRIALLCHLDRDESIYGASVRFTPRLTNRPR